MKAQEAFDYLDPQGWAKTTVAERLALINQVRANLANYAEELGMTDSGMKNKLLEADCYSTGEGMMATAVPIALTLNACKFLYESLDKGEMPQPIKMKEVITDLYMALVFPISAIDVAMAGKQKGCIFIEGEPKQVNPLDKPAGIIAVSGAGNYSSSIEMVMAMFFDNKAVIHKPHRNNAETDKVWEKVFRPLVDAKALAFCDIDESRPLMALDGLDAIYFTGSTDIAHIIRSEANAPLVSECGGNNPCIIVPSEREWTKEEMRNQAVKIVSAAKLNGGAVCGRPQTIVICKNWKQREEFISAIRQAISTDTYACCSYYPKTDERRQEFMDAYPDAEVFTFDDKEFPASKFALIRDLKGGDHAVINEAFCQILGEVALDTEPTVEAFLDKAVEFVNNELLGSLAAMIVVDNETHKAKHKIIKQVVLDLHYGGVAVNTVPPNIWLNPYITWGGYGESEDNVVSGVGNFGNCLNYNNVVKSVLIDDFDSPGIPLVNREAAAEMFKQMTLAIVS